MNNDRYALLVGVSQYTHPHVRDLPAVRADLHYMKEVLERLDIGMFNPCTTVAEPTRAEMMCAVEDYLADRQQSETALLYFSGHGQFDQDDGQLYFLTRDADPQDLPHTAVSAEFLHRQLQECRAASKLVLLDCCDSGSVAQSLSAKGLGPHARDQFEQGPLRPRGVYVITASDALQEAFVDAPLGMSRFTGEIVEGLRKGLVSDGTVTVDALFAYVTQRLMGSGVAKEQRPTRSMVGASGTLVIARSPARAVTLPAPPAGSALAQPAPEIPGKAAGRARAEQSAGAQWERLLSYYLACMTQESAGATMPRRDQYDRYDLLDGIAEHLMCGSDEQVEAPEQLPRSESGAAKDTPEIWYGYPVVTLPHQRGRRVEVRLAPLLMQQLEQTVGQDGRRLLRPAGLPFLHPGVLHELLDQGEAAGLTLAWQPTWQHGNAMQMQKAIRDLLREVGLDELTPLDPLALSRHSADTEVRRGAHNTAILLTTRGSTAMTAGLVDNLAALRTRIPQFERTALAALLGSPESATGPRRPQPTIVSAAPLNERQQAVIQAVLTRRLTVAAGPAGTGKSQLVTALNTTARSLGWSVLIASTNNQALTTVESRCDGIAPGLLIRTGNEEVRKREAELLGQLLQQHPTAGQRSSTTHAGTLHNLTGELQAVTTATECLVGEEVQLDRAAAGRVLSASALRTAVSDLAPAWAREAEQLAAWSRTARRRVTTRWFGTWRRRSSAKAFRQQVHPDIGLQLQQTLDAAGPDGLRVLADFADNEVLMRRLRATHDYRELEVLNRKRLDLAADAARVSQEYSRAQVREQVATAERELSERRTSLIQSGSRRSTQRALMGKLPSWAVTTHSVQQLELQPGMFDLVIIDEASQCSVPAILPLLFRAKHALIIGDAEQLRHITTVPPHREQLARRDAKLSASWLEQHRVGYIDHSAYDAAAHAVPAPLLLDEHYRCHPAIASVVNGYCYAGRLRVLTDVRNLATATLPPDSTAKQPLRWRDVSTGAATVGPHGTSWRNHAEITQVESVVEELLAQLPDQSTIGVITPFRAQADALKSRLKHERVKTGTIHAFQGDECDAVILSLVLDPTAAPDSLDWVAAETRMWNVAITRARAHLTVVGDLALWSQRRGLPALLADHCQRAMTNSPAVRSAQVTDDDRTELANLLQARLEKAGYADLERDAMVGGYPCDFVVSAEEGNLAILIDPGPSPDEEAARHLRLLDARARLLTGLDSGGNGAAQAPLSRVIRVPAWRIRAQEPIPGLLIRH
ncbi:caspase, EACC1-associated type [Streptacidiphilus fuscans]|uniref:Caspase family protein n=1 Tax=Streptacidiphilus fuscans TaxID=2789292 RepID=A0A931B8P1_9ACTN|nr:AAA domain-containing protein [Streptacidiphilus fuscans]MBF9071542.1 caspase family protein [Streptacidiphilus fuscans]